MTRLIKSALLWLITTTGLVGFAAGNTEKTIFLAPEAIPIPADASIDSLYLTPLNHQNLTVRTYLKAEFPSDEAPRGVENWLLLQNLTPGRRYEVRVCWLATQPTNFWLYTHTLTEAFENPELLASLSQYAHVRRGELSQADLVRLASRKVFAAADYFTLNQTLMNHVPPVLVDVILDPFLFNALPQSLVRIVANIIGIAVGAWFISGWISNFLRGLMRSHSSGNEPNKTLAKKSQ